MGVYDFYYAALVHTKKTYTLLGLCVDRLAFDNMKFLL